jgi:hypothetical protein
MNDIERINKQTELIKEVLVELIQTFREIHSPKSKAEELYRLENKITTPIEPTQPEGYQGLNKWYNANRIIFYCNKVDDKKMFGYGIDLDSKNLWFKNNWISDTDTECAFLKLATESEIKEAILKGCEQNGIVEGAMVKSLMRNKIFEITDINSIEYYSSNDLWSCGACIFDNGKFAEVVKEEKIIETSQYSIYRSGNETKIYKNGAYEATVKEEKPTKWDKLNKELDDVLNNITDEEFEEWYNKRKLNKATTDTQLKEAITEPTDKELLKECLKYIEGHAKIFEGGEATRLQTKLNKHLNHD